MTRIFLFLLIALIATSIVGNRGARLRRDVSFRAIGGTRGCTNTTVASSESIMSLLEPCETTPSKITNDVHTKWDDSWYKDRKKSTDDSNCNCDGMKPDWSQYDPQLSRKLDECDCGWKLSSGRCEQRRCSWGEALWVPTGECVIMDDHASQLVCAKGQQLYIDPQNGHATCDCLEDHVYWPAHGRCYQIYSQGPCPQAMLLRLSDQSQTPTCIPNPCLIDGLVGSYGWCYSINPNSTLTLSSVPPPGKDALKGQLCDDECTPMIDPFSKSVVCANKAPKKTPRTPPPVFTCRKGSAAAWEQMC